MDKILVSILVPVYNTSQYLRTCLDSLVGQTLKNVEIICVNDGSTDDSPEILEEYAQKYPQIKVIHKPNGGLPSARNAGIDNAVGEYVGFVDSDDYVEVTMFEKLYKAAVSKSSDIVVCGAEIFPEDPAPTQWLRDVLSPRDCHYEEFTPDVLFKEQGARPFIWRNLIRRDLLIRENIRLKEDIVLGEDQALQFKVFPKAKGITFLSDKLYHYCWYRPGSIMSAATGNRFTMRVEKHTNLCLHVMDELEKSERCEEMRKDTLVWIADLLYDDFIKLPYADRKKIAERLTARLDTFGYWQHHNTFEPHISDMFRYFYFIAKSPAPEAVEASIVVNLYNSSDCFAEFEQSVRTQTLKNVEIIFINNAADGATYLLLHRWLTSDYRVRVFNHAYEPLSVTFNEGLGMAVGRTVLFADSHDFLSSPTSLEEHIRALDEKNADLATANPAACADRAVLEGYNFYEILFKREFLTRSELVFEEYHALTTKAFATRAILLSEKIALLADALPIVRCRSLWRRDWVYTKQANAWLTGYLEMLRLTGDEGMVQAHRKLVDELNSDKMLQIILNATNAYLMHPEECPNGENSQSETFRLLCEINRVLRFDYLGSHSAGTLRLLREFVNRRHAFLTGVMKY